MTAAATHSRSNDGGLLPLVLKDVSITSGNKRILKDLNVAFTAEEGLTTVLGPNGAGKSLLLRLLHGLIPGDTGTITWGGKGDPGLHEQKQSMVFQRPVLLRRSVKANIAFALKLHGIKGINGQDRVDEMLALTGLTRFADRPARQLSFGEQQRLALARALSLKPQLLILDEPCASLDPAASYLVESILKETVANGTRVIMSTHDLNQARRLADDVIFMFRGRIKERAKARMFFDKPENDLAEAFLKGELLWWKRRAIFAPDDGKEDDRF